MNSGELEVRDEQTAGAIPEDVASLYSWAELQGAKYRDFSALRREKREQVLDQAAQNVGQTAVQTIEPRESVSTARVAQSDRMGGTATGTDDVAAEVMKFNSDVGSCGPERVNLLTTFERAPAAGKIGLGTAGIEFSTTDSEPQITNFEPRTTDIKQRTLNTDMVSALDRVLVQKMQQPDREIVAAKAAVVRDVVVMDEEMLTTEVASAEASTAPIAAAAPFVPRVAPVAPIMASSSPLLRSLADCVNLDEAQENGAPSTSYGKMMRNNVTSAIARVLAQNAEHSAAKAEAAKNDAAQAVSAQTEAVAIEVVHLDAAQLEAAELEMARRQAAEREAAQMEAARLEAAQREVVEREAAAQREAAEREVARLEAEQLEAAEIQAAAQREAVRLEAARLEAEQREATQRAAAECEAAAQREAARFEAEQREAAQLAAAREPIAGNWSALEGIFGPFGSEQEGAARPDDRRTPVLAVFSLAGGVGKTNLVATLGRALSAQGQAVLLADTTSRGLLPFYFGARGIRPGEVRAVEVKSGVASGLAAALGLALYDAASCSEEAQQQALADAILRDARSSQRVLLDLTTGASWLVRRLVNQRPVVLVPMACDMNSVISLHSVEKIFQGMADSTGQSLRPFYVLNQFDESLALDRDVRDVLRRQLGDRLLQQSIRRAPAVSEALAAGMTVVDYAPDAPVSREFAELATWLRIISPAAAGVVAGGRNA